jgi:hypothetical protein
MIRAGNDEEDGEEDSKSALHYEVVPPNFAIAAREALLRRLDIVAGTRWVSTRTGLSAAWVRPKNTSGTKRIRSRKGMVLSEAFDRH